VLAAGRRLEQVFLNLLVNATHALQEAGGAGEVTVTVQPGASGEVVAEVRDTGPGMTPEVRARVFEPFDTTKPVGSGTGLGLAICHGIVASCGGRIDVESEPGRGSAFRVVLPALAAAPSPPPIAQDARPDRGAAPGAGLPAGRRVLVVDDDPLILRLVTRALGGGEVVTLADPHEALRRLLGGDPFDLVICDLMMPGLSGMDLFAALAQARPEEADRLIFMTGGAFTPRAREFLSDGDRPCLEKPFEPEALRRLVGERLTGRPARVASFGMLAPDPQAP
jgi:CheY-like chemotaxis protein